MRARVVAASIAIHGAAVLALIIAGGAAPGAEAPAARPPIDVEIAPPVAAAERARPASTDPGGSPGGERVERTPVRRAEPPRTRTLAHRRTPVVAPPIAAPPAPPVPAPADDVRPDEPPSGDGASGGGNAIAGGEGGAGRGIGAGVGDGEGVALDLSAPAVPLEANTSEVLPYTEEAMRDRIAGYVHLVLMVDPLGHVGRVTVRRGLGHGLDEIATRRAMQIMFRPARDRAGKPTVGTVRWRFHFQPP